MASLLFRHGDAQALKAIIAAPLQLKLVPLKDADSREDCLVLKLQNGIEITDANAMAQALSCVF